MPAFRKAAACLIAVLMLLSVSFAGGSGVPEPTATPEPVSITRTVSQPPEVIQEMLLLACEEWESLGGKALPRSNKYTKWVNDAEWGWCAGFTSWCAMKAGVPQSSLNGILQMQEGEAEPVYSCSAVSPGKLLRAFQYMHRTTLIPQKGFFILYGDRTNYTTHIGIVFDAEQLENGKYRLTTIEGNMKSTVRMFIADYEPKDVYYEQHRKPTVSNLTAVPEEERDREETKNFSYRLRVSDVDGSDWYVTCFLMTWVPEGDFTVTDDEEVSP